MWTYGNPSAVNQALGKTGSQFRLDDENGMVPTSAPATPAPTLDVQTQVATPSPQAAQPQPVQAAPAPLPAAPADTTTSSKSAGLSKVQDYASKMKQLDAAKEAGDDNMQRVGTLIGSVLSFWGGDYMGGAQGVQSVSKMGT